MHSKYHKSLSLSLILTLPKSRRKKSVEANLSWHLTEKHSQSSIIAWDWNKKSSVLLTNWHFLRHRILNLGDKIKYISNTLINPNRNLCKCFKIQESMHLLDERWAEDARRERSLFICYLWISRATDSGSGCWPGRVRLSIAAADPIQENEPKSSNTNTMQLLLTVSIAVSKINVLCSYHLCFSNMWSNNGAFGLNEEMWLCNCVRGLERTEHTSSWWLDLTEMCTQFEGLCSKVLWREWNVE